MLLLFQLKLLLCCRVYENHKLRGHGTSSNNLAAAYLRTHVPICSYLQLPNLRLLQFLCSATPASGACSCRGVTISDACHCLIFFFAVTVNSALLSGWRTICQRN